MINKYESREGKSDIGNMINFNKNINLIFVTLVICI